ncbi:MAG: ABC transporter substrate-binding protein [Chloroflexota bacterium]|nr:ABC transporter substrate-binding protein [Chloroflexota bacterium]
MRHLTTGHSPDADDAFMFYALTAGLVPLDGPEPAEITAVHDDIQSLNERAQSAELDISQISAAAHPGRRPPLLNTPLGSSMGENYGPVVVAPRAMTPQDLAGARIAVPGPHTTAFSLARMYLPAFQPVQVPFDQAFDAVDDGRAQAAVVIHEGQLTYAAAGFSKVLDLGQAWFADTGLPLPLGINIVRRDLGDDWCQAIATALAASIDYARANPAQALQHARAIGVDLDEAITTRFTDMYVTDLTRNMGPRGHAALTTLYQRSPDSQAKPVPLDIVPAP